MQSATNSNAEGLPTGTPTTTPSSLTSFNELPLLSLLDTTVDQMTDDQRRAFRDRLRAMRLSPPTMTAALRNEASKHRKVTKDVVVKAEAGKIADDLLS